MADTLSRIFLGSLAYFENDKKEMFKELHLLAYLGVILNSLNSGGVLVHNGTESSLMETVKGK